MRRSRAQQTRLGRVAVPLLDAGATALQLARTSLAERRGVPDASFVELIETVAAVSAGSKDVDDALLGCIRSVCQWTGWPVGHAFLAGASADEPLQPSDCWHVSDAARFASFREITRQTTFARGVGLPGRVAASARPAWIGELAEDPNFPRRDASAEVGLRGALAFPVMIGARCFAVVECYSERPVRPDHRLLEVFAHVGRQLGRLIAAMQTEQALRESDTRFRSVAESATDAIVAADRDGLIVSWNRGAEKIFGYAEDEVRGESLSMIMPERYRSMHEEGIRRIADHGTSASRLIGTTVEVVGLRKDGREFPLELALATWESPDGRFFSGIIRDITERRKAADKIQALLETAPDPIVEVGARGAIILANARTDQLFGYERAEITELTFDALFAERSRMMVRELLETALNGRELGNGADLWGRRKDGSEFPVDLRLSSVPTDDGEHLVTGIVRDITERKRFETQLKHLADHDALTELFNRRRFEEELEEYCAHAARYHEHGAVLLLDLDRFKYVNDTHGHKAGDEVIRTMASALRDGTRKSDVVARLGGDEFAVLLKNVGQAEAERVAEEMLRTVRERELPVEGGKAQMTTSIGIALFSDEQPEVEELLVSADLAMYAAKEQHGNRFEVADAERHLAGMQARLGWIDQIRRGLDEDRFVLYCQPILDLHQNEITQYELLLRLIGDDGEVIPPAAFIDAAERFGLIQEIDRMVISRAIGLLHEHGPHLRLEVNVSGKSLSDPMLPEVVEQQLEATGVDPAGLIIEITETAAIANMEQARAFADRLTALGCRFALDDFGAGFSSFYYLKYLPLDYLKIDGDFIRSLTSSPTDQLVVQAMVDIARGMGMKTVAEFVESSETVTMLQRQGVDYSQGFFHGEPRPVAEVLTPRALRRVA